MFVTIYELLGMVKDDKAPKKIKYNGIIWKYDGDYYYSENNVFLEEYCNLTDSLNDEVEILEEEKKIPEKLEDFNLTTYSRDDEDLGLELNYTGVSNTFNDVYFKINEIIDYLYYLKSKGE